MLLFIFDKICICRRAASCICVFDKICICRRVAKAYARAPVLTVNGSDDGFDGFRLDEDNDFLFVNDDNDDVVQ